LRFLRKATGENGTPEKITIDKSRANTAAIENHNAEHEAAIEIRQIKCLNNIAEQDHRAVKRLVRLMLGFRSCRSVAATITGIELMHMIRKGQLRTAGKLRPAQQFYSLARQAATDVRVGRAHYGNLRQNRENSIHPPLS
jgi:transposase-like protein